MKNIFDKTICEEVIIRINKLDNTSLPKWGKMNVAQMLSHCNVTYELTYENKVPKPNWLKKVLLKAFVKPIVVGEKAYKRNSPTAPEFKISGVKDFDIEKERLIKHINQTQEKGASFFEGKENHSFGVLTSTEWNNMFYKHLDHHLNQFNV